MDTSALGAKHTCPKCDARFFDLNKTPVVCPKCQTTLETEKKPRVRRAAKDTASTQEVKASPAKGKAAQSDDDDDDIDIDLDDDVDVDIDDDDIDLDDDEDDDLMEDASDLGGDEDEDMSGIIEHMDDDNEK